jgi:hypothetical protein
MELKNELLEIRYKKGQTGKNAREWLIEKVSNSKTAAD